MPDDRPYSGITVLDLSVTPAGQFCTKLLRWLGARVILAEHPSGAPTRRMGPFAGDVPGLERSLLFAYLNTGKSSVTVDVENRAGAALVKQLVAKADVLVEDYAPGYLERFGLSHAALQTINPKLIMLSITPFGQDRPYRDYKARDINVQAIGLSQMVGEPDRAPLKLAGNQGYYNGALHGLWAVALALTHRDHTGEGQYIDVALGDSMVFAEWKGYTWYSVDKKLRRRGQEMGTNFSAVLPARDGYVGVSFGRPGDEERMRQLTGLAVFADPAFIGEARVARYEELKTILEGWTRQNSMEAIYHGSQKLDLTFSYFPTALELMTSPQYTARGFFATVAHPEIGEAPYPGMPIKYGDMAFPAERAPLLGEHNGSVYGELLGTLAGDLVRLREQNVI